jgi:hypothetical protein
MVDYNVNVKPLLGYYNKTNNNNVSPLIPADNGTFNSLVYKRGYGLFDPAPIYPQTHDYGHALSEVKPPNKEITTPVTGDIYVTPFGGAQTENSWDKNINYDLKPYDGDNYEHYDEYQKWAYKATKLSDPYLLPYYFSHINIKYIQNEVIKHVKKTRNITIQTKQDTDNLLNIMLSNFMSIRQNQSGVFGKNSCTNSSSQDSACLFSNVLANLNKITIEQYIKAVLSALNISEYYIKDISTLPVPLSNPKLVSNKGKNELGFVGFFEDNHKFTNNLSSFNSRDLIPGKIQSTKFGN